MTPVFNEKETFPSLYEIPFKNMDGSETSLTPYQGQVMLIVNVASRCGFTPQYEALEAMHREYQSRGFAVLGFPCDQFRHQEPGNNQAIKAFATSCFNITFPLFSKIDVKGPSAAPLYSYLKTHIEKWPLIFIPWNFTKILIDKDGHVLRRYWPTTSIKTVRKAIEALL